MPELTEQQEDMVAAHLLPLTQLERADWLRGLMPERVHPQIGFFHLNNPLHTAYQLSQLADQMYPEDYTVLNERIDALDEL